MALSNGPNLGLLVNGSPAEEHYDALMHQWRGLDALVQPTVISVLSTPPVSPPNGATYIIGPSPTGPWAGLENRVARFSSVLNIWEVYQPKFGWEFFNSSATTRMRYTSGGWIFVRTFQTFMFNMTTENGLVHESPSFADGVHTKFILPYNFYVVKIFATLGQPQTTGVPVAIDVTAGGDSLLDAGVLEIANGDKYSLATLSEIVSSNDVPEFTEMVISVQQTAEPTTAQGLKVCISGFALTV